ncbi:MAG: hypothetical protein LPK14_12890 [Hymenobacteraceae bacterium]|mgnify:CR=1 FL=1|nr:hypothetical protein [Hymenobacteraceae bacterium]MDX5423145.1 hypothetical protein [Hymenobacteraceae bacterium]
MHQQEAQCLSLCGVTLERLKDLQANRARLLKALQSLKVTIKELLAVDPVSGKTLQQVNSKAIKGIEKSMEKVEEKMQQFIAKDEGLNKKYDLLTGIKCLHEESVLIMNWQPYRDTREEEQQAPKRCPLSWFLRQSPQVFHEMVRNSYTQEHQCNFRRQLLQKWLALFYCHTVTNQLFYPRNIALTH